MEQRCVLTAGPGMVFTNGCDYGKRIYLGSTDKPDNWHEIPEEEKEEELV